MSALLPPAAATPSVLKRSAMKSTLIKYEYLPSPSRDGLKRGRKPSDSNPSSISRDTAASTLQQKKTSPKIP